MRVRFFSKRVKDALEASIEYVKEPISREAPHDLPRAVEEFLKRDAAKPGPYTLVYQPQQRLTVENSPRTIDELIEYLKPPTEGSELTQELAKDVWHIISQNPYILPHQKRELMRHLVEQVKEIEDLEAQGSILDKLMSLPDGD